MIPNATGELVDAHILGHPRPTKSETRGEPLKWIKKQTTCFKQKVLALSSKRRVE